MKLNLSLCDLMFLKLWVDVVSLVKAANMPRNFQLLLPSLLNWMRTAAGARNVSDGGEHPLAALQCTCNVHT